MLTKFFYENDGTCFAMATRKRVCSVMKEIDKHCGTYSCPFYKPEDCADWIRVDRGASIALLTPEEVSFKH